MDTTLRVRSMKRSLCLLFIMTLMMATGSYSAVNAQSIAQTKHGGFQQELVQLKQSKLIAADREVRQQAISGTVRDAQSGETMPGVNVFVTSNPSTGTSTDENGAYSLTVADDADSLSFSFVGYQSQQVAINGRSTIDIQLQPEIQAFDEMVVTAFGVEQEQRELGYSVQQIDSEQLTAGNDAGVVSALQGKISGV